jgi:DNA-binding response OmpR family regulator
MQASKMEESLLQKILVVDDDVELCELLSEYLEPEGFHVESVHDGKQGLERCLSGKFSLLILDVMLPSLKGFEALRRIRAQSGIPVIMLTAKGDDVDRILGLESGADDYVPKPFNPRELLAPSARSALLAPSETFLPAMSVLCWEMSSWIRDTHSSLQESHCRLTSLELDLLALFSRPRPRTFAAKKWSASFLGRETRAVRRH